MSQDAGQSLFAQGLTGGGGGSLGGGGAPPSGGGGLGESLVQHGSFGQESLPKTPLGESLQSPLGKSVIEGVLDAKIESTVDNASGAFGGLKRSNLGDTIKCNTPMTQALEAQNVGMATGNEMSTQFNVLPATAKGASNGMGM